MLAHAQGGIRVLVTHLRLMQHYRACKGGQVTLTRKREVEMASNQVVRPE